MVRDFIILRMANALVGITGKHNFVFVRTNCLCGVTESLAEIGFRVIEVALCIMDPILETNEFM